MSYWNNFNKKFRMTYESSKKILCCKLYVGTFFYVSEVICKTKRKDAKKYANFRNRNLTVRKLCLFMFSHISSFIYTPLKKIWQRLILFYTQISLYDMVYWRWEKWAEDKLMNWGQFWKKGAGRTRGQLNRWMTGSWRCLMILEHHEKQD